MLKDKKTFEGFYVSASLDRVRFFEVPLFVMDPVPIDNRSNSCDKLLLTASKLVTIFKNAAVLYHDLAPAFTALATTCDSFAEAAGAIQSWLTNGAEKHLLDPSPWYQLTTSLRGAEKVITILEGEIQFLLQLRYGSKPRPKVDTKWNLEALQSHEEDVKGETEALHQILQYMRILSITDMSPKAQADSLDAAEQLGTTHASVGLITSIAGDSWKADTENTLDQVSPPYNLLDVRTGATHTEWYVGAFVNEREEEQEREDLEEQEENSSQVQGEESGYLNTPAQTSMHQTTPGLNSAALGIISLTSADSDEVGVATIASSNGQAKVGYRVDNLQITLPRTGSFKLSQISITERESVHTSLPNSSRAVIEDLKISIKLAHSLLVILRKHFRWNHSSGIKELYGKLCSLFFSCVTVGAAACDTDIELYTNSQSARSLSAKTGKIRDIMKKMHGKAQTCALYYGLEGMLKDSTEDEKSPAISFAAKTIEKYGTELGDMTLSMATWSFYLQAKRLGP